MNLDQVPAGSQVFVDSSVHGPNLQLDRYSKRARIPLSSLGMQPPAKTLFVAKTWTYRNIGGLLRS